MPPANLEWAVENSVFSKVRNRGANLISDEKFTDFKLHLEFRYPKDGNSGMYLRGRYEVQITDSKGLGPLTFSLVVFTVFLSCK